MPGTVLDHQVDDSLESPKHTSIEVQYLDSTDPLLSPTHGLRIGTDAPSPSAGNDKSESSRRPALNRFIMCVHELHRYLLDVLERHPHTETLHAPKQRQDGFLHSSDPLLSSSIAQEPRATTEVSSKKRSASVQPDTRHTTKMPHSFLHSAEGKNGFRDRDMMSQKTYFGTPMRRRSPADYKPQMFPSSRESTVPFLGQPQRRAVSPAPSLHLISNISRNHPQPSRNLVCSQVQLPRPAPVFGVEESTMVATSTSPHALFARTEEPRRPKYTPTTDALGSRFGFSMRDGSSNSPRSPSHGLAHHTVRQHVTKAPALGTHTNGINVPALNLQAALQQRNRTGESSSSVGRNSKSNSLESRALKEKGSAQQWAYNNGERSTSNASPVGRYSGSPTFTKTQPLHRFSGASRGGSSDSVVVLNVYQPQPLIDAELITSFN